MDSNELFSKDPIILILDSDTIRSYLFWDYQQDFLFKLHEYDYDSVTLVRYFS